MELVVVAVATSLEDVVTDTPLGGLPKGILPEPLSTGVPLGRAHASIQYASPGDLRVDPVATDMPQDAASTDMPFETVSLDILPPR